MNVKDVSQCSQSKTGGLPPFLMIIVLIVLCLMMLSGCSKDRLVPVPEPIRIYPPEILLMICPNPALPGSTYRDLVEYAVGLEHALALCNIDKQKLREWSKADGQNDD